MIPLCPINLDTFWVGIIQEIIADLILGGLIYASVRKMCLYLHKDDLHR